MVAEIITEKKDAKIVKEELLTKGKWYSERVRLYYTKHNWPKRKYWYNQVLWRDYKDNKIQGNTMTDV